jgi:hypothetical protein
MPAIGLLTQHLGVFEIVARPERSMQLEALAVAASPVTAGAPPRTASRSSQDASFAGTTLAFVVASVKPTSCLKADGEIKVDPDARLGQRALA